MPSFAKLLVAAGLAMQGSAKTITVSAGKDGALKFDPSTVKADKGDVVEFHFFPKNHSVVMGDWKKGCSPNAKTPFYSGWFPTASGEASNVFSVTINETEAISFYCSQGSHCKGGMYGVINPSGDSTLEAYGKLVSSAQSASSPSGGVSGGVVGPASGGGSGSGSGSSSSTSGSGYSPTSSTSAPATSSTGSGAGMVRAGFGGLVGAVAAAVFMF